MMAQFRRPHLLGIDDGPFRKGGDTGVPVVGVLMEVPDVVEGVALTRFPIDGDGVTDFLAGWIRSLRFSPGLHGIVLGGITIAGLAVVEIDELASRLELPVLVVNREDPARGRLDEALRAAGLTARLAAVARTPAARRVSKGLWVAQAGATAEHAAALVLASRLKSQLPEPLRLAHLIGAALVAGQSRGRP